MRNPVRVLGASTFALVCGLALTSQPAFASGITISPTNPIAGFEIGIPTPLENPSPQAFDRVGYSVAGEGANIVTGAPIDGDPNRGAFHLSQSGGAFTTTPNPNFVSQGFGEDVAINSTRIAVGATSANGGNGRVYVYDFSGNNQYSIDGSGGFYGGHIGMTDTHLLVGAYDDSHGDIWAEGSAFLYNASNGSLITELTNPNENASFNSWFGRDVALSDTHALIGSTGTADNGRGGFLYDLSNPTGNPIWMPGPATNGSSINSVGLSDSYALIGTHYSTVGGEGSAGSLHVYNLSGTLQYTLENPEPNNGDNFGRNIATWGDYALLASGYDNNIGRAYLYDLTTGDLIVTLDSPTGQIGEQFGSWSMNGVALTDRYIAIGAPESDVGALDQPGRVYLYEHNLGGFTVSNAFVPGGGDPDIPTPAAAGLMLLGIGLLARRMR